jgi:hypothetical protein
MSLFLLIYSDYRGKVNSIIAKDAKKTQNNKKAMTRPADRKSKALTRRAQRFAKENKLNKNIGSKDTEAKNMK